jgi:tetratricopeptide (TPR) repeat protein
LESSEAIQACEQQIEAALWGLEVPGEHEKALEAYQAAHARLLAMVLSPEHVDYREQQRVLAFCLMREANILRQMGRPNEAFLLSEQEIAAARQSGDEITLGRSLMSKGTSHVAAGEVEYGLSLLDEAGEIFQHDTGYDYRQGLGWCWILQVDLVHAGYVEKTPPEVIEMANKALELLLPIQNWPGVARAFAGRALAYEHLGDPEAAEKDRQSQQEYQSRVSEDGSI